MAISTEQKQKIIRISLKVLFIVGAILIVPVYLLYALWCIGALIYIPGDTSENVRLLTMGLMLLTLVALPLFRPRRYFVAGGLALMMVFSLLLNTIKPTNNITWAPEYERLPKFQWAADNDSFKLHDIRSFYFRTTTDFDVKYHDAEFKLSELKTIDFISVYWPQPCEEEIAHIMLRFRFNDGKVFLISSETRRTGAGEFGAVNNLYKQSGKIYVVATEDDVLALRTNIREPRERVYIYEMELTREQREQILRNLAERINDLHVNPQFYNTLTGNCLTELLPSLRVGMDLPLVHYSYLASGRTAELLFAKGYLKRKPGETFEELKARSYLNPHMEKWDHNPATYGLMVRAWEKENGK